ncbi:MAG: hypothetical protein ABFD89_22055 [Bryobacteraceae bacterium]
MRLEVVPDSRYADVLEQILASRLFSDAPVQRKLLSYLAEKAFAGTADNLKEYSIGVELFSKPESYSPQSDPSVRVQTSRLRTRLDEYYRTEGTDSPIVIHLPKGSFTLVFEPRSCCSGTETNPEQPVSAVRMPPRWRAKHQWQTVAVAAVLALLTAALAYQGFVVHQLKEETRQLGLDPYVARLWQPLLSSPRPLVLVIGMPIWIRLRNGYFRHISVNSAADVPNSAVVQDLFRLAGEKPDRIEYGFNGLGETMETFLLGRLFFAARKPVTISRSNTLSWEELRSQDVVLLGSSKSNPHLRDMPLLVHYALSRGGIRVLHPSNGEPDWYRPTLNGRDEIVADYAIVARLPGVGGNGYIMVLGAETTAGNWAAAEIMTDPRQTQRLASKLVDRNGNVPELFEMVLRAEFRSLVSVKMEYVTHHVISR